MPTPLLPDTVAVARLALLAQSSLTALVGTRIYDRVPAVWPTSGTVQLPLVVVSTVDDQELEWHTLSARVQVDVWGASGSSVDTETAKAIARRVIAVARDLRGVWTGGTITDSAPGLVIPQPDPTTGRARFVTDLRLELMP